MRHLAVLTRKGEGGFFCLWLDGVPGCWLQCLRAGQSAFSLGAAITCTAHLKTVAPAQAGAQFAGVAVMLRNWIPACAGMTVLKLDEWSTYPLRRTLIAVIPAQAGIHTEFQKLLGLLDGELSDFGGSVWIPASAGMTPVGVGGYQ